MAREVYEYPDCDEAVEIAQFIDSIDGGNLSRELYRMILKITQMVEDRRRQGEVTLKLKFKPNERDGEVHQITVEADTSAKEPRPDPRQQTMNLAPGHRLTTDDPRQPKLPDIEFPKTGDRNKDIAGKLEGRYQENQA